MALVYIATCTIATREQDEEWSHLRLVILYYIYW